MRFPEPTDRVRFRAYRRSDESAVGSLFADPQARRFYPEHADPTAAARWIEWTLESYERHGVGLWAIELVDTGEFVGDCGLTWQPVEGEMMLEIGYHVDAAHRGRGYATEAALATRRHAFENLGENTVCSIVHPANEGSLAVAGRLHPKRRRITREREDLWLYWSDGDDSIVGITTPR